MFHIEGVAENIIYRNEDNGYTVCDIYGGDKHGYFTAVGIMPYVTEGMGVLLTGSWTENPSYGEQFHVDFYELVMPSDEESIETYLASGAIPGIGETTAARLVEKFGKDVFTVMLAQPERLAEIKGISKKKAARISEDFAKIQGMQNVIMFLQQYHISVNVAAKVYKILGSDAVEKIKENPYILSEKVLGIGFKTADNIAFTRGIPKNSIERLRAGIKYILASAAYDDGHTYMPKDLLEEHSAYNLDVDEDEIENAVVSLVADRSVYTDEVNGKTVCYLSSYYSAEVNTAKKLLYLAEYKQRDISGAMIEELIEKAENETGIILAGEQRSAVITAAENGVTVLTGGPGTGKTTTINTIIKVMRYCSLKIVLAAPTGRAAKRMSEVTGLEAQTIHRLLKMCGSGDGESRVFERDENDPVDADVIIVDEMSMVDIMLMNSLLRAIRPGTKLILSGDADQLPSVGAGNVLSDIIKSGVVETVRLDRIFRQAEESLIVVNAHRINSGEQPELKCRNKDFFFLSRDNAADIAFTVSELCRSRLPSSYGLDPVISIQVLSPMKKGNTGVIALNGILQRELNPPAKGKKEHKHGKICFREGDKVMQIKNNYDIEWTTDDGESGYGIFNGDMGIIEEIDTGEKAMTIIFDDTRRVIYGFSGLDELELSYAITVHKSQGSEFPVVVMPVYHFAPALMCRNLFYTAVTRAKDMVVLVGSESAVKRMVENNSRRERFTALEERMRVFADAFRENVFENI
ncbi:MAG: ATP-dependent RecD-like DNA helicase [Oscillospiraceae bacterium]|nr:ATP-dependent RecD-like DNA helicase [Oscillospiraceae bacterium]